MHWEPVFIEVKQRRCRIEFHLSAGTVGVIELARAFAANPAKPKRSLLFVDHINTSNWAGRHAHDCVLLSVEDRLV